MRWTQRASGAVGGAQLLLAAVAGNALRPPDRAALFISAGTATTVNLVTDSGVFAGGAIWPGLGLGARSLQQFTALLPLIDIPALLAMPEIPALGRNTAAAIRSGLWYGHLGGIRELVMRIGANCPKPPCLFVTGGNGQRLASALGAEYQFTPELALRGLASVALRLAASPESA
mgnify:CR=1 FL=1